MDGQQNFRDVLGSPENDERLHVVDVASNYTAMEYQHVEDTDTVECGNDQEVLGRFVLLIGKSPPGLDYMIGVATMK